VPNGKPSDDIEPLRGGRFPELTAIADPALRVVARLIRDRHFRQLYERTGLRFPVNAQEAEKAKKRGFHLPVLLQLDAPKGGAPRIAEALHTVYRVPRAYSEELERNRGLKHVTARLPLDASIFRGFADSLVTAVSELRKLGVKRVYLGALGQPSPGKAKPGPPTLERSSLAEMKVPGKKRGLTGKDVIIGIIDDGCALAHNNFLKPRAAGAAAESRILYFWDQGGTGSGTGGAGASWSEPPPGFDEGRELNKAAIDAALNRPAHRNPRNSDLILEDRVYDYLGYLPRALATHGTHVMDIAAGNGQSLMGIPGVAPDADIIFVQLPTPAIEGGATALAAYIVEGAKYIFKRAREENKAAVVNISFGGYDGPHDGTSELEKALDGLLAEPDRAVVLAAGNGFEERCHAARTVRKNTVEQLRWIVRPMDPTANDLEIWYENKSQLYVRLTSPGPAIDPPGWIQLGQANTPIVTPSDGKTIGSIEHLPSATGNTANQIVISLNGTYADDRYSPTPVENPAPAGTWIVELKHQSGRPADVHAWIWRDDAGRPREGRRRQSRFHPDDAVPTSTIAGWATGRLTISTGAYNTATQEICRYSACGPTRATDGKAGRPKPEIYAPGEEDVRGRGVLSASARSARPTRMNGTSAAAPHIAGLIALIFEA
jgi:subtilisin family serine protease